MKGLPRHSSHYNDASAIRYGIWNKGTKMFWRKGIYRLGYKTRAEAEAEIVRMNEDMFWHNLLTVKPFEANSEEL